jgi:hypothetical protein
MRQDRRGSWYLLTGAVLGVALGLVYSWVVSPVQYVDAPPYALRADYKNDYRALVAAAYLYRSDLVRAEDRLAQLKDDRMAQSLTMQAQQALAEGHPEEEVKALSLLALALTRGIPTPSSPNIPTPGSGEITPTQGSASSPMHANPLPITPPASQAAESGLVETKMICNPDLPQPLIQVIVQDSTGQGVPGVEVVVLWEGGEDHFFTGLKAELGKGYADFTMTPGVEYALHLAAGGQAADGLTAAQCLSEDGAYYWGSWLLTFTQP